MPCEPPCRHWTHHSSRKPLPVREPLRLPKNEITPTIRDTESHPSCPAWAGLLILTITRHFWYLLTPPNIKKPRLLRINADFLPKIPSLCLILRDDDIKWGHEKGDEIRPAKATSRSCLPKSQSRRIGFDTIGLGLTEGTD